MSRNHSLFSRLKQIEVLEVAGWSVSYFRPTFAYAVFYANKSRLYPHMRMFLERLHATILNSSYSWKLNCIVLCRHRSSSVARSCGWIQPDAGAEVGGLQGQAS